MKKLIILLLLLAAHSSLSAEQNQAHKSAESYDVAVFFQRLDSLREDANIPGLSIAGTPGTQFSYNPILYSWASRPIMAAADAPFSTLVERETVPRAVSSLPSSILPGSTSHSIRAC